MKYLIAVPSKKRADIFEKHALSWLKDFPIDWCVFVEQEDLAEYKKLTEKIVVLPQSNKGLGYSKTIIKQYAEKHGYDLIFKVDDDVKGFTDFRRRPKEIKDKQSVILNIMQEVRDAFEQYEALGCVSFPYDFQMYKNMKWEKVKRVQTCFITRTEHFHADEDIAVHEDFAVGIYQIVNNRLVFWYRYAGIMMGVDVGGGTGGHQSYNRKKVAENTIDKLREMYPPLKFRKVEKVWDLEPDLRSIKFGIYK